MNTFGETNHTSSHKEDGAGMGHRSIMEVYEIPGIEFLKDIPEGKSQQYKHPMNELSHPNLCMEN